MNATSTSAVSYSVATSSSASLSNDGEKFNQPNRVLFLKYSYGKISMKSAFYHPTEVVFINVYWKDDSSGKTSAFCKHKSSHLHNQAVEVIYYSLPRSGCDV